jgi:hypothetical protein
MTSVRLEGDPITHGALMTFEDGVPLTLYRHIRASVATDSKLDTKIRLNSPALAWQDALR